MYIPWLGGILGTSPLPLAHWGLLLGVAALLLVFNDVEKAVRAALTRRKEA
jgi:hypothetical protein